MTQVLKVYRFEQLIGGVALLFLATLFNSHGMRLICLALALRVVTLAPENHEQSRRLVMVGALTMISVYLGSLPGLFCLVVAEFASHLMSGRLERNKVHVMDLAIESLFFVPLIFAFLFDLLNMSIAAEVAVFLALGLKLTQWPLNLKASPQDDVDRVTTLLFGIAIVKMLSFTNFENWPIGAAVLLLLSGLTLNLSQGAAVIFAFLTVINPNCAVFAAGALFCTDHERVPSLLLPLFLIPPFFLIQIGTQFGENWWVVIPLLIFALRGFSQASFKVMNQKRQEDISTLLVASVLLAMGVYVLRKDFASVFVAERLPEFVLSSVALLSMPLWTTFGKIKSPVSKNFNGFRLQDTLSKYTAQLSFGKAHPEIPQTEKGQGSTGFDEWTAMEKGPVLTLLGFVAILVWGVFWVTR